MITVLRKSTVRPCASVSLQQLFPLAFLQPGHRDAGPARDDPGDLVVGDDLPQQPPAALPDGELLLFGRQAPLEVRDPA